VGDKTVSRDAREGCIPDELITKFSNGAPHETPTVYERRQKEEHTLVLVLSAFLRAKYPIDKRERSELPSNRRISAYVRVVVLGVVRRAVFWAGKTALT